MASKVPKFGNWEDGDVGYTGYFETARKVKPGGPIINPNDLQMNRDVPSPVAPNHTKPKLKQKPPPFGAWDGGEDVPYTQMFDLQNKNEPQMNREVGSSRQPKETTPRPKPQGQVKFVGNEPSVNQNPLPNTGPAGASARPQQRPPASRGQNAAGRGGSVPVFGDWNNNPGQAGGYTVVFDKLQEDKKKGNVPSADNPPRSNRTTPTHPVKQPKKGGCFPRLFFK